MRPSPLAALLLAGATAASAPFSAAADEKVVNVVFSGKLESDVLDAGGTGTLVLSGDVRPTAWVLADPSKFVVTPIAADGVAYGKVETTEPAERRDPKLPDAPPVKVWTERIVVRIPFTLAANAPNPVEVGVEVTWTACDEGRTYDPEKTEKPIVASVRRAEVPAGALPPVPPIPVEAPPPEGAAPKPAPAPVPEPVPAPPPQPAPATAPAGRLGAPKKEHNVDVGDGKLALRLTVPADVSGLAGVTVGVDVFFYDEQGRAIRSTLASYADAQGTLRVTSKNAPVDAAAKSLDFAFLVPYAAFPSRGAKYTVEARASLSVRSATKEGTKLLATTNTTFQVE